MKVLARLLVVALVVMAGVAAADDSELTRRSLKGLKGVTVIVENLNADVEQDGLTKTAIQTNVERKLRLAGIPVLSEAERLEAPGCPYLYIHLNTLLNDVRYAYALSVELNQTVQLTRDPSILCVGVPTWSVSTVGTAGRNNIRQVRDFIRDQVDQFINAYLSVNPK